MRVVLIDPDTRRVTEVDCADSIRQIKGYLGSRYVDRIDCGKGDGLWHSINASDGDAFVLRGKCDFVVFGRALLTGTFNGYMAVPTLSVDDVRRIVEWR